MSSIKCCKNPGSVSSISSLSWEYFRNDPLCLCLDIWDEIGKWRYSGTLLEYWEKTFKNLMRQCNSFPIERDDTYVWKSLSSKITWVTITSCLVNILFRVGSWHAVVASSISSSVDFLLWNAVQNSMPTFEVETRTTLWLSCTESSIESWALKLAPAKITVVLSTCFGNKVVVLATFGQTSSLGKSWSRAAIRMYSSQRHACKRRIWLKRNWQHDNQSCKLNNQL